jgi:hypothetical protein
MDVGTMSNSIQTDAQLDNEIARLKRENGGHIAEKQALRIALSRLSPNHPLLTNATLRKRVQDAGHQATTEEAARAAGSAVKY